MCSVSASEAHVLRRNDLAKRNISGTESNNLIVFESEIRKYAHAIIIELRPATDGHESLSVSYANTRPHKHFIVFFSPLSIQRGIEVSSGCHWKERGDQVLVETTLGTK